MVVEPLTLKSGMAVPRSPVNNCRLGPISSGSKKAEHEIKTSREYNEENNNWLHCTKFGCVDNSSIKRSGFRLDDYRCHIKT
ncbi:hypothetical protein AM410_19080 [Enterobacter cloacae complex sp. FDA-CDC-AR_0164]|nr:hypothetical protein AM410_19080 [Enterobacter cloacae complex sp. FDA-CDC-AR_0164]